MNPLKPSPAKHGGFALVFVLWILMLAGFLAAISAERSRSNALTTVEYSNQAALRWSAKAGLSVAMNEIAAAKDRGETIPLSFECRFGDVDLRIELQDEQGKLDLNVGRPEIVQAVLVELGVDGNEAVGLSESLADYVDPDDLQRSQGAEAIRYRGKKPLDQPRNGPLISLMELGLVLGWDTQPISKLSRHFTVHSGKSTVDRDLASTELLRAIDFVGKPSSVFKASNWRTYTVRLSTKRDNDAYQQTIVVEMPQIAGQSAKVLETAYGFGPPVQGAKSTNGRSCI